MAVQAAGSSSRLEEAAAPAAGDALAFYREMTRRNIGVYTAEEQERLRRARVLVCGLGGVGGMEAILAARMGIGGITGIDPDAFDATNLNRQMLATVSALGRPKAEVAAAVLREINPHAEIRMVHAPIDEDNVREVMAGHDLVLEAVDDMPSRVIIHRTARRLGIPSVGMSGSPPHRGFVSSFFPDGVPYEAALNLPGLDRELTDPALRREIAEIKKRRAWHAVERGAPAWWAEAYAAGREGWIITPVRAVLIATFAFHEAVQILTGRRPLAVAPRALLIDLDADPPVRVADPPPGGWDPGTL